MNRSLTILTVLLIAALCWGNLGVRTVLGGAYEPPVGLVPMILFGAVLWQGAMVFHKGLEVERAFWKELVHRVFEAHGGLKEFDRYFDHIYDVSPWIRNAAYLGQKPPDLPSPRIIKSHDKHKTFFKETKGRFIFVYRNGMDVAVSLYNQIVVEDCIKGIATCQCREYSREEYGSSNADVFAGFRRAIGKNGFIRSGTLPEKFF